MNNLMPGNAVLRATITITRAATGKQETVELVGVVPHAAPIVCPDCGERLGEIVDHNCAKGSKPS